MKMKNNFFRNGVEIILSKQTNILSAAVVIMVNVALSRLLGLVRDRMLATYFGSDIVLDIFFAAFRLPDMIFQLLVMGVLATAFIPVITSLQVQKKEKELWHVASSVLNIGLLLFMLLSALVFLFSLPLSKLIAPGFNLEELILMAKLTKIMLFGQLFFILSNFLTGILQSYKHFIIPAVAPVFYNLGIIIGVFLFTPFLGIYGPALGVILGTIFHFLVQLPLAKRLGLKYKLVFDWRHKQVKEIGRLMLPRTIGLAVAQVDYNVDVALASLLSAGSITYFNFAQHLQLLPVGLFGSTIAQAALPTLAEEARKKSLDDFKKTFIQSLLQILYLVLPFSVLLIILRVPLVRIVFGAARFDWQATIITGQVLAFFSLSIFAQALVHLFARGFYALHDSQTPVVISIISIFLNVLASLVFILLLKIPVWGLGLSTSIANIFNLFLLFIFLDKKIGRFNRQELFKPVIKIFFASFLTAFALWLPMRLLDRLIFDTTRVSGLLFLTFLVTFFGLLVYLFLSWLFKIEILTSFLKLVKILEKVQKWLGRQNVKPMEVLDEASGIHS